jgi:hypothetical protein
MIVEFVVSRPIAKNAKGRGVEILGTINWVARPDEGRTNRP